MLKFSFFKTRHLSALVKVPPFLLLCLLVGIASCNALKSALTVQPGKQFELGGNQKGAFTVMVKNVGEVPVTISERQANGPSVVRGIFKPGDRQTVRFSAGSAALVDNATARPARLDLVVTGDKDLSMKEIPGKPLPPR
jgi:hypothetical protein